MEVWGEGGVRYRNYGAGEVHVQLPPPEMSGKGGQLMRVTRIAGDAGGAGDGVVVVDQGEIFVLMPGCEYLVEWLRAGDSRMAGRGEGQKVVEGRGHEGLADRGGPRVKDRACTRAISLGEMKDQGGRFSRKGTGPGGVIHARTTVDVNGDGFGGRETALKVEIRGHVMLGGEGGRYAAIFVGGTQVAVTFGESIQETVTIGGGAIYGEAEEDGEGEQGGGTLLVSVVVLGPDGRPTGDSLHSFVQQGTRGGVDARWSTPGMNGSAGGVYGVDVGHEPAAARVEEVGGCEDDFVKGGGGAWGGVKIGDCEPGGSSRLDAGGCEESGLTGYGFVVEATLGDQGALRDTLESLLRPRGESGTVFTSCAVIDPGGLGLGVAVDYGCLHVIEGGMSGFDEAVARMNGTARFLLRTDDSFIFTDTDFMQEVLSPNL